MTSLTWNPVSRSRFTLTLGGGSRTSRRPLSVDVLSKWLREWAEWIRACENVGWSDATTLWWAQFGQPSEFKSSIPAGIEQLENAGPGVSRVHRAIESLLQSPDPLVKDPVLVVARFYLLGKTELLESCEASWSSLYQQIKQGELLIRREMQLR